jgi:hypothetical protein
MTERLLRRIRSEFTEMPGLRLTCRQAQRLFGLDEATCAPALEALIHTKFLRRIGPDVYARLTDGRVDLGQSTKTQAAVSRRAPRAKEPS